MTNPADDFLVANAHFFFENEEILRSRKVSCEFWRGILKNFLRTKSAFLSREKFEKYRATHVFGSVLFFCDGWPTFPIKELCTLHQKQKPNSNFVSIVRDCRFFLSPRCLPRGDKRKYGCPEHEIRRLLFWRSVKKPHGGEEKKKNVSSPCGERNDFYLFFPIPGDETVISTPLRENLPYVLETRTKNGVFLTRRKKNHFSMQSSCYRNSELGSLSAKTTI